MDKEHIAIERLQEAALMSQTYYKQPLIVTTSGGKDSSVCIELALRAGIPFEVLHNHTTVDAPETVYFVRSEFKRLEEMGVKCTVNAPQYKEQSVNMWSLIVQKSMPPTRLMRYCCSVLKESGGKNRMITTGVRWEESARRKNTRGIYETIPNSMKDKIILANDNDDKRRLFETCTLKAKRVCNPIVDWGNQDVWNFLRDAKIPVNPLYMCGFERVGCVGCPMAGKKMRAVEFARWPTYKRAYIRAFDAMLEMRKATGKNTGKDTEWKTGEDVYHWWMEDGILPGQTTMEEYVKLMDDN